MQPIESESSVRLNPKRSGAFHVILPQVCNLVLIFDPQVVYRRPPHDIQRRSYAFSRRSFSCSLEFAHLSKRELLNDFKLYLIQRLELHIPSFLCNANRRCALQDNRIIFKKMLAESS